MANQKPLGYFGDHLIAVLWSENIPKSHQPTSLDRPKEQAHIESRKWIDYVLLVEDAIRHSPELEKHFEHQKQYTRGDWRFFFHLKLQNQRREKYHQVFEERNLKAQEGERNRVSELGERVQASHWTDREKVLR